MKRCQIGVGGRNALDNAHDIMAECYGTLGALAQERDRLRIVLQQVFADAQAQDVLPKWWPLMEDALGPNDRNQPGR